MKVTDHSLVSIEGNLVSLHVGRDVFADDTADPAVVAGLYCVEMPEGVLQDLDRGSRGGKNHFAGIMALELCFKTIWVDKAAVDRYDQFDNFSFIRKFLKR